MARRPGSGRADEPISAPAYNGIHEILIEIE